MVEDLRSQLLSKILPRMSIAEFRTTHIAGMDPEGKIFHEKLMDALEANGISEVVLEEGSFESDLLAALAIQLNAETRMALINRDVSLAMRKTWEAVVAREDNAKLRDTSLPIQISRLTADGSTLVLHFRGAAHQINHRLIVGENRMASEARFMRNESWLNYKESAFLADPADNVELIRARRLAVAAWVNSFEGYIGMLDVAARNRLISKMEESLATAASVQEVTAWTQNLVNEVRERTLNFRCLTIFNSYSGLFTRAAFWMTIPSKHYLTPLKTMRQDPVLAHRRS
jgi:hypothetical protein